MAGIVLAGVYLTRPIFSYIHATRLREMFTALALLIVVAIACLMLLLGLSPALGTFLAGVVLANSEFRHEIEADLEPFKGLLLGLFFITVGAGIDVDAFLASPGRLLALTLLLMAVKGSILYLLAVAFRLRGRDRWLFTLGLAQAGEFGFVLGGFMLQRNVVPLETGQQLFLIVALSMLLTPLFFILYEVLVRRMRSDAPDQPAPDEVEEQGPIIIAGMRPVRAGGEPDDPDGRLPRHGSRQRPRHDPADAPVRLQRLSWRPDPARVAARRRPRPGAGPGGGAGRQAGGGEAGALRQQVRPEVRMSWRGRMTAFMSSSCSRPAPTTSCARCSTARFAPGATCWKTSG